MNSSSPKTFKGGAQLGLTSSPHNALAHRAMSLLQSLNDPRHKKQFWQWSPNSPVSRPRPHGLTPLQKMNMLLKG